MRAVALFVAFAAVSQAVLPPGYEDELYCPEGYCQRDKEREPGWTGPASEFHECVRESDLQANHNDPDTKKVTPWGENDGHERKQQLKEDGFHDRRCSQLRDL
eukprot:gnl/TRDRNA2_/TRDRNA2_182161_c0_seq1.p3 gnl/TRDRNA2_/TRDRNA2_182161_c0~~gnl/TRDRNA2_/TRDRNA2_182161_c0_seq1.p3  ORF type:complete len:103 (+),score=24.37 gnl/TRDRNA2_/TRDRNA2_182161_c0_seq1:66-374(+)